MVLLKVPWLRLLGQFSELGSLFGILFNKDAVLYQGPKKGPNLDNYPLTFRFKAWGAQAFFSLPGG